jgi:hypothetical protein
LRTWAASCRGWRPAIAPSIVMVLVCCCDGMGWEVEPVFGEVLENLARYG